MGVGARETARLLKMGPNTERDYREALAREGLLDGAVDELPALDALKAAVTRQLAKATPTQMVSSIARWESRIVKLAEEGLTAQPIHDRLRLEEPDFQGSYLRQGLDLQPLPPAPPPRPPLPSPRLARTMSELGTNERRRPPMSSADSTPRQAGQFGRSVSGASQHLGL